MINRTIAVFSEGGVYAFKVSGYDASHFFLFKDEDKHRHGNNIFGWWIRRKRNDCPKNLQEDSWGKTQYDFPFLLFLEQHLLIFVYSDSSLTFCFQLDGIASGFGSRLEKEHCGDWRLGCKHYSLESINLCSYTDPWVWLGQVGLGQFSHIMTSCKLVNSSFMPNYDACQCLLQNCGPFVTSSQWGLQWLNSPGKFGRVRSLAVDFANYQAFWYLELSWAPRFIRFCSLKFMKGRIFRLRHSLTYSF